MAQIIVSLPKTLEREVRNDIYCSLEHLLIMYEVNRDNNAVGWFTEDTPTMIREYILKAMKEYIPDEYNIIQAVRYTNGDVWTTIERYSKNTAKNLYDQLTHFISNQSVTPNTQKKQINISEFQ